MNDEDKEIIRDYVEMRRNRLGLVWAAKKAVRQLFFEKNISQDKKYQPKRPKRRIIK